MTCSRGRRPACRALLPALVLGLMVSLATILPTTGGAVAAVPTDEQLAADQPRTPARCGKPPFDGCRLAWYGAQAPTLVVWGDSHMWMMTPAVQKATAGRRINVVLFHAGGCIPAAPDMTIYAGNACAELSISAMRYLQQLDAAGRPYRLLLGSFWGANLDRVFWYENQERADIMAERRVYTQNYTRPLFRALGKAGIPTDVQIQGPISVPPSDCGLGAWPFWCPVSRHRAYYKDAYVRNWLARRMSHLREGARLVDYSRGICSASSCPAVVDGTHTWFDPYHLSATRAAQLASYYKPTVRKLLRSR